MVNVIIDPANRMFRTTMIFNSSIKNVWEAWAVDFEPRGNQTQMEWSMQFETAELFEVVVKTFKADEGFKQSVGKLENYLKG